MKLSAATLAGLAAAVSAQGINQLPECAQSCATNSIPDNCDLDIKCICSAEDFIASITCCVADSCSEEDQETTIQFANGLCGGVGVEIPQSAVCTTGTSAGGSMTMTTMESSMSTSEMTETGTGTGTATATATGSESGTMSETASETGMPTETASESESGSESSSATESAPQTTGTGAAAQIGANGGALAAFAAAVAAFL